MTHPSDNHRPRPRPRSKPASSVRERERHARAISTAAFLGRQGDTELAHLTEGEMVIPPHILTPELHAELAQAIAAAGADMGRYTVGGTDDSLNPATGAREYWWRGGDGSDWAGCDGDHGYGGGGVGYCPGPGHRCLCGPGDRAG